jgi:hypothetical protein
MSKLSEIVSRRRSSGQSRTGALFGSLKDKVKETIDPRRIFNQTGILTALFPSLKAYKSDSTTQKFNNTGAPSWLDVKTKNVQVESIEKNTQIFAKNSMYFSEIARDINVSRINVGKLVKLVSPAAAEKTDMYYKKTSEMEKSYESKFKSESKKSTRVDKKSKKSSFSWIKMIGLIGTVGVSYLLLDFIKNKEESIIKEIYDELDEKFDSFKNNFLDFKEKAFIDFDKERIKLIDKLESQTDDEIDTISKDFTFDSIYDYIVDGTGPLKKYETYVSDFKGKLAEAATNVFPAAAASSLPVVTPKTDTYTDTGTGNPSLGRTSQNTPTRSGTRNTNAPTGYSELIGKYEGAGKYDTVFGKAGGAKMNGKLVTENTIAEVVDWQKKNSHTNRHAAGKYGFINVADVAKLAGISPNALFNAETQERMQQAFTQRSMQSLTSIGIQPTYENLSLAHTVGPAGAKTLLTAQKSGRGNSQAADILHAAHGNLPRDPMGGNNSPARKTNPHLLKSVDEVISENRKRFKNTTMQHNDVPDKISFVPPSDNEVSANINSMSRVAVMKNVSRGKEVLIVNRETVSIQNQTEVASNANTEEDDLDLLISYVTD